MMKPLNDKELKAVLKKQQLPSTDSYEMRF